MTIQPKNNNLNYLIDPAFTNVNRLFVLSFPRNDNTDSRYSYSNYYEPKVKISEFNVLTDGKRFFDLPVKNKEEDYQISLIFKKNYKLIATDLSKQTKLKDLQQINFIGKLSRNTGATMFFIIEKSEETTVNFLQNSVTIV